MSIASIGLKVNTIAATMVSLLGATHHFCKLAVFLKGYKLDAKNRKGPRSLHWLVCRSTIRMHRRGGRSIAGVAYDRRAKTNGKRICRSRRADQ